MVEFKYDSATWRRIRVQVLKRDDGLCQIRGSTCRVAADRVDHVVPIELGGAVYMTSRI